MNKLTFILNILIILFIACSSNTQNASEKSSEKKTNEESGEAKIVESECDTTSLDYFSKIKFPYYFLDSLNSKEFSEEKYLDFSKCDYSIFSSSSSVTKLKYISLQDTTDNYVIMIYHQGMMENYVALVSFDKNLEKQDLLILFHPYGESVYPDTDFKYEEKVINISNENKKVIFDSFKFTLINQTFYSLRDNVTGKELIDIGSEKIQTYTVDKSGKFKLMDKSETKKDYVKAYWESL